MSLGAVSNEQCYLGVITRPFSYRVDLSASPPVTTVMPGDPRRVWVIDDYQIDYDIATVTGSILAINFGTAALSSAVAIITPAANQAAGTSETCEAGPSTSTNAFATSTITHGSTYTSTRNDRCAGKPEIPINTPIIATTAGGGGNGGEVTITIWAHPLDDTTMR